MERDFLFREIVSLTNQPKRNGIDSKVNFEFSPTDISRFDKYKPILSQKSKTTQDASSLTNFIFFDLHPDLNGRKLKDTDPEKLKNEWKNIYYQIVLPFLGKSANRTKFYYTSDLIQKIAVHTDRINYEYTVLVSIGSQFLVNRLKTSSFASFLSVPEVGVIRNRVKDIFLEQLIPLLIEGLNLNKSDQVYEAIVSLDNGAVFDRVVDVFAYDPTIIEESKRQQTYDQAKKLLVSVTKGAILTYLDKRKPSDIQRGEEPDKAKGENVKAKPLPDNPAYNLTGKFEHTNTTNASAEILGFVLTINQAGRWIEGFLSIVVNRQVITVRRSKEYYRFYADIVNWNQPVNLIFINGSNTLLNRKPQLLATGSNSIQLILDGSRKFSFQRVASTPMFMERHMELFPGNAILKSHQWYPLLSAQEENIRSFFYDFKGYKNILPDRAGTQSYVVDRRKTNLKNQLTKRINGDKQAFTDLYNATHQFFDELIHQSDLPLASFYIRHYLNQKSITDKDGWTLTLASWLYRFNKIDYKQYSVITEPIYGDTGGDKMTSPGQQLVEYKIDIKLVGLGAGFWVKGGYYRGDITISCKQWATFGITEEAKLGISLLELGGGFVESLNFGQSFSGVAQSDVLWKPGDFVGSYTLGKADAEVGVDLTEIKKKLGISAGLSGTLGIMEIESDAKLPPLKFDVYSVGGVIGGIEPEPNKEFEEKIGFEVTASMGFGSIWKTDKLPAPKDIIKYGNEKTMFGKLYWGQEKAHFKHDSALLTVGAENLIRKMCANELALLVRSGSTVEIIGHTDRSGSEKYNQTLSENRAANVKQKLIDICGSVLKASIKAVGKGETLAKQDGIKDGTLNPKYRRVDILLNGIIVLTLTS